MVLTTDQKIARSKALRQITIDQLKLVENCATQAKNNIDLIPKFKVAYGGLKRIQKDFEKHHNSIVASVADNQSLLNAEAKILEKFSLDFIEIETLYNELIADKEQKRRDSSFNNTTLNQTLQVLNSINDSNREPRIDLPIFSGEIQNFPMFIELFDEVIHNRNKPTIEKFNYLLSKLRGPAFDLVKNIPICSDNYQIVYNALRERYDNKRLRAVKYWKAIQNCKPITKDNYQSLRSLLDTFNENLEGLRVMSFEVDKWDFIISNLLLDCLDNNTRKAFEQTHGSNDMPTYQKLKEFLNKQCTALETVSLCTKTNDTSPRPQKSTFNSQSNWRNQNNYVSNANHISNANHNNYSSNAPRNTNAFFVQTDENTERTECCLSCKGPHIIYNCPLFLNKSPSDRFQFVKSKKACVNCMASFHNTSQCTSQKRCRQCNGRHHSLLHFPVQNNVNNSTNSNNNSPPNQNRLTPHNNNNPNGESTSRSVTVGMVIDDHEVLLSTVLLNVKDAFGNLHQARAVLDPGAQSCFIVKKLADKLGLPKYNIAITLQGLSKMCMPANSGVHCEFSPLGDNLQTFDSEFIIIDNICDMPNMDFSIKNFSYLKGLKLADPQFNHKEEIQILLGAEIFPFILQDGRILAGSDKPACLNTVFGWTVMGKVPTSENVVSKNVNAFLTMHSREDQLDNTLKRFWQSEEFPDVKLESPEDKYCEEYFLSTVKQEKNKQFTVSLPFKVNAPDFGDTRSLAMRRLLSLERRLQQDKEMYSLYCDVMKEYLEMGHMEQVSPPVPNDLHNYFYIAHHAVIRKESVSTPLRVVYDASSHAFDKISLNQALHIGPKLQRDLVTILLNFRMHKYVAICDIRKMYRMIWVEPDQRKYQRILWRFSAESPILDFELKTVTFGVACSPYLAIRTLLHLSNMHTDLPLAFEIINNQTFVDDCSFGHNDLNTVINMRDQLIELLSRGNFELRKWASNTQSLLIDLPESHVQNIDFSFDLEEKTTLKILGLKWCPTKDTFYYPVTYNESKCTKRTMLSELAKTYDPLGFLTPVTFYMKWLIQHLWTLGIGWDEPLDSSFVQKWINFKQDLTALSSFEILRQVDLCQYEYCQIIGFCDASIKGTCAVTYLRVIYSDSSVKLFFLYAKSKIAPLKTVSLPRLELNAAALLSKLISFLLEIYNTKINIQDIFAFSDSTVALSWIKSSPHTLKTYVANRVSFIQERLPPNKWYHVSSKENAADCGSRGLFATELIHFTQWWSGSEFLLNKQETWNLKSFVKNTNLDYESEVRKNVFSITRTAPTNVFDYFFEKYSCLAKIKRLLAYVLRFVNNTRKRVLLKSQNDTLNQNQNVDLVTTTWVNYSELHEATLVLVKHVQHVNFSDQIACIQNNEKLPKSFLKLKPFLDDSGMLRVGGRLCNSELKYDQKFPLLLPSNSGFTDLLIKEIHICHLHTGIQTTCFLLNQKYWVLGAKRIIRKLISKCIPCWKINPQAYQPQMGNLPDFRVKEARPFLNVGVDLAGPYSIKMSSKIRNTKILKAWICLFICCSTKCLHIELLSELSTESFLAGFRRFIGRRSLSKNIYSDCGTNFIGANNYLNDIFSHVAKLYAVKWHFNPPAAPHFGGLWESNIKSTKVHLQRVIGSQVLTYEELNTVLIQIEAVLNSRPLTPISSDPSDLSALTPAHFLTLGPICTIPDPDTSELKLNHLSRWQLLLRMHTDFWKRWKDEYLQTLTQRAKWHLPESTQPALGTMVLIKGDNSPPLEWPLGRIIELIPGNDKIYRVAVVKTAKGIFKRPLVKLCPLPLDNNYI